MTTTATIPAHTIDAARAIDLAGLAERYGVTLRRESASSLCGPCPKCGGHDRFWLRDNRYNCRSCGISGDPIEFTRMMDNCTFVEAVGRLTGTESRQALPTAKKVQTPQPAPKPATAPAQDARWTDKATKIAADASHALMTDPDAEIGRDYLLRRGIEPRAWWAFKLGFRPAVPLPGTWDAAQRRYTRPGQPAIVMPWFRGDKVTAIRYRFLETHAYPDANGRQTKAKQTAQPGSTFEGGLYGGQALPEYSLMPVEHSEGRRVENYRTLVICEGELNAISIWQTTQHWGWDVLSLGSETAKLSQPAIEYARCFERVIVWMDKESIAKQIMAVLMPLAYGVHSPQRDAATLDANDLLQGGFLDTFLVTVRLKAAETEHERQRVKWDLFDAATMPPFVSEAVRKIAAGI